MVSVLEGLTVQVGQEGVGRHGKWLLRCIMFSIVGVPEQAPFFSTYMLLALMFISLSQAVLCVPTIV